MSDASGRDYSADDGSWDAIDKKLARTDDATSGFVGVAFEPRHRTKPYSAYGPRPERKFIKGSQFDNAIASARYRHLWMLASGKEEFRGPRSKPWFCVAFWANLTVGSY